MLFLYESLKHKKWDCLIWTYHRCDRIEGMPPSVVGLSFMEQVSSKNEWTRGAYREPWGFVDVVVESLGVSKAKTPSISHFCVVTLHTLNEPCKYKLSLMNVRVLAEGGGEQNNEGISEL